MSQRQRFRGAALAAILSGILQAAAFPPFGASWVILAAFVPLFWAAFDEDGSPGFTHLHGGRGTKAYQFRRRFMLGFLSQLVFNAILLSWILNLPSEEVTIPGIMIPSLLFMSAYLGIFFGLATAVAGWIQDRGGPSGPVTISVLWVLADIWRSTGVLGFPWGSFGYALAPHPAALQMSAWTGYWGLPFWILLVNALWTLGLRAALRGEQRIAMARNAAGVCLTVAPLLTGMWILSSAPGPITVVNAIDGTVLAPWHEGSVPATHATGPAASMSGEARDPAAFLRVALVQANTAREIKWEPEYRSMVIADLLERTIAAAGHDPDLIVWPETAAPLRIFWEPLLSEQVRSTVAALKTWVLVGTLDAVRRVDGGYDDYNAAILLDPDGNPVQRYFKMHLVPFSEAMPFREAAPWLNALNFGQSDFSTGEVMTLFRAGDARFGTLICFESIFPGLAGKAVSGGARYLVNITNDFWFGRSAGPVQHAQMSIHRAVETRTPVIRCANSGISFIVDAYGRTYGETELFVDALLLAEVPAGEGGSFHTRHGDWFVPGLVGLGLLCVVSGIAGMGGRRRQGGHGHG